MEEKPPKVPFGSLIENSYIEVGEKMFSKDKKYYGEIQADSSIKNTIGIGEYSFFKC